MKTLDEIIKRIEIYKNIFDKNGCFECHYREDDCIDSCFLENVLHYLNTIETTENLYHDAVNELSKWKDEDWKDRCLPLTWNELKQMEGKPIWMEFTYHNPEEIYKYWTIVKYFDNDEGGAKMITGTGVYHKCDIDTDWQAYRKENNGR